MKRIRVYEYGAPEQLVLEEAADPTPGAGEVLVRVHAAGVNPYDSYMRAGTYGARTPALPFTPGSDAAGIVESIGDGVNDLSTGQRVYTTGTLTGAYAQLTLCQRSQLFALPENVSFAQGAGVFIPYATAYRALFQLARATLPDSVLVHGASGGVGIAAMQFAHAAGLTVIGTAGTAEGLALIRAQGAHHAVNHQAPDYQQQIMRATDHRGVDVILEMQAHVNLGHDLKMLAAGGRVIVIGSRGDVLVTPRDLMQREAFITGMMLWNTPELELAQINRAVHAALGNGSVNPVIGLQLPLSAAALAHRRIGEPGAQGKMVLLPYAAESSASTEANTGRSTLPPV